MALPPSPNVDGISPYLHAGCFLWFVGIPLRAGMRPNHEPSRAARLELC
jgi:hypothetical protein